MYSKRYTDGLTGARAHTHTHIRAESGGGGKPPTRRESVAVEHAAGVGPVAAGTGAQDATEDHHIVAATPLQATKTQGIVTRERCQ